MLKDKNIWIILIASVFIIITVFGYLSTAATAQTVSGYLVLMDQKASSAEYSTLGVKSFESIIYLPGESGEGTVTSCSFDFSTGVDERADITEDGRVDRVDIYLAAESFGCNQGESCWNQAFTIDECYFTYSGRQFKDPTRDCKIDIDDVNSVAGCFGEETNPLNQSCEVDKCCKEDVNKDGKVDMRDVAIVGRHIDEYADVYKNYGYIKKGDIDLNSDGKVDMRDIGIIAREYGQVADHQTCENDPLEHVSGNKWRVKARGRGLHYVGASYRVFMK